MTAAIAKTVNTVAKAYIFPGDSSMVQVCGMASSETCCGGRRQDSCTQDEEMTRSLILKAQTARNATGE